MHAGQHRTRIVPMPGEVWLRDGDECPVIIVSITRGRITFVMPTSGGDGNAEKPYRESYCGAEYFFAEEWTRLWPPAGRRHA